MHGGLCRDQKCKPGTNGDPNETTRGIPKGMSFQQRGGLKTPRHHICSFRHAYWRTRCAAVWMPHKQLGHTRKYLGTEKPTHPQLEETSSQYPDRQTGCHSQLCCPRTSSRKPRTCSRCQCTRSHRTSRLLPGESDDPGPVCPKPLPARDPETPERYGLALGNGLLIFGRTPSEPVFPGHYYALRTMTAGHEADSLLQRVQPAQDHSTPEPSH
jgi:hypothetical protein